MNELWRDAGLVTRAALTCAALSALVFTGSFFGLSLERFPLLSILHLLTMAWMLVAFVQFARHNALGLYRIGWTNETIASKLSWDILRSFARPAIIAAVCLFASLMGMTKYGEGGIETRDGKFIWINRGTVVQTLTEREVLSFRANELRLFSSAWFLFCLMGAAGNHVLSRRIVEMKRSTGAPAA